MAKEIGNWEKQAQPKADRDETEARPTAAALVIGPRLDSGETLLWASHGSGRRPIPLLIWIFVPQLIVFGLAIFALAHPITAALGPMAFPVGCIVCFGPCAYLIGTLRYGPQMEVYAVTDRRAVILRQYFPFLLKTCKIRRLRVDGEEFGSILFGKEERQFGRGLGAAISMAHDARPDPGFYGIAKPRDVAYLIVKHIAPDAFVDTYARMVDELSVREAGT